MTIEHKPTDEQQVCIDTAKLGKSAPSVMISAYAGAAKSTTLEMIGKHVKVPTLGLAFNRSIADEMKPRFDSNFSIKTLNGLGHMAWARVCKAQLKLDDRKLGRIITELGKAWKMNLTSDQWDSTRQLVSQAMMAGIVPRVHGDGLLEDSERSWRGIADEMGMFADDFEFIRELAHEALCEDIEEAKKGIISFDDQIYMPTLLDPSGFPKFPALFGDEVQDWSPLNHAMVGHAIRPDARLWLVGDQKQSVYRFRGAANDSMSRAQDLRGEWLNLPLATTFRCPKVMVERQQKHAPGFRAWHTNAEGNFYRSPLVFRGALDLATGWTWEDVLAATPAPGCSIAILCRHNAPLFAIAMKLLRKRVAVVMLGRDIGKGLIALLRKLCPEDCGADVIIGKVNDWRSGEIAKCTTDDDAGKASRINDRADCLLALLDGTIASASGLERVLHHLFSRSEGQVTLSSIHRFKGRESDMVVHLDPWRSPSRRSIALAKAGDRRELEQELNLNYVCETRTRHTFVQANLEDYWEGSASA